jgi:hypothetical protein
MQLQAVVRGVGNVVSKVTSKAAASTKRFRRLEIGLAALCASSPILMIVFDSCRDALNTAGVCVDEEGIRSAISYYWDMPAAVAFYVPLTVAAMLFVVNGVLKKENEYNWVLGTALAVLVVFNTDQFNPFHLAGVFVFFAGNVIVVGRAFAKNFLKIGVLGAAALFFVAGNLVDSDWSENWLLWLEWASLLVIATHFILVAWISDKTYEAPRSPQKRAEQRATAQ